MKRNNLLNKAISAVVAAAVVFFLPVYLQATITSITGVTMSPPSPNPGDPVSISFTYIDDTAGDNPLGFIVISDTASLRPAGTAGQWLVLGNGCTIPASPATDYTTGCQIGSGVAAGTPISAGPYNFNLPAGLASGVPYYIIVGMGTWWCQLNPDPGNVNTTGVSSSFTLPLPPAAATISKAVEAENTAAGYRIMYTISYDVVNTQNFVILDTIPPELSFWKAYNGGMLSGGNVIWNFGNVGARQTGTVSWFGTVNAGVPDGTTISNMASCYSTKLNAIISNIAFMTTGPHADLGIAKSAAPGVVNTGETITYTLTYNNNGSTAEDYVPFDSAADIADWTVEVPGGTWNVSGGIMTGTTGGGTWPKLIKNTPSFHDGIFISDLYVPSSNAPGDAVMLFNFIDLGNMYHARIQADAHQICFDKVVGGSSNWSQVICVNDASIIYDRWYTIKAQVRGSSIKIKAWQRGTTEPGGWAINVTDTSLNAPGRVGFQINEAEDRFDNLKIYGPGPAMNTRIYDTLPPCTTFVGCSDSCTESGGFVRWDFPGRLDNALNETVSFWVTADSCAAGTNVTNTACIDSDEDTPPECSNEAYVTVNGVPMTPTITPTVTVTPTRTATPTRTPTSTPVYYPTLVLTKTSDVNPADPGGTVVYTISYINNGVIAANNVLLTDALSTNLTYVSATGGGTHNGINPGGTVSWNIASIAPGGSGSVSFSAIVNPAAIKGTIIQNQAIAVCTPQQTAANSNTHTLNLNIADLKLKEVTTVPNPAVDNAEIIFNLTVAARVRLKFYTVSGELIRSMEPDEVSARLLHGFAGTSPRAGNNSVLWDCMNSGGKPVSSGVYFYRVDAESFAGERAFFMSKMAVLK